MCLFNSITQTPAGSYARDLMKEPFTAWLMLEGEYSATLKNLSRAPVETRLPAIADSFFWVFFYIRHIKVCIIRNIVFS